MNAIKNTMDPMVELEQILRTHAARYLLMQPADAVKLIYQNEFGGGHLIADPERFETFLRREYDSTPKDPAISKYEPIGNGIVRVNLAALAASEVLCLGALFIDSASLHQGKRESFEKKLAVLQQLTMEGIFPFSSGELASYLEVYAENGYPAVSHSAQYREAYRPAYRIVLQRLLSSAGFLD